MTKNKARIRASIKANTKRIARLVKQESTDAVEEVLSERRVIQVSLRHQYRS